MPDQSGNLTPGEAAAALGMSPSALRRAILDGYFSEPGVIRIGRRRQRSFSPEWIAAAKKKLADS
jgi:hypothetical protein